jgi:hypothetical protein
MQYGLDTAIRTQAQNRTLFYAEIVTAFKPNFSSTHSLWVVIIHWLDIVLLDEVIDQIEAFLVSFHMDYLLGLRN